METNFEKIRNEEHLNELLSSPGKEVIRMFSQIDGDIIFLGVSGKIGPYLARMAKRACDEAGVEKRITGVDRFEIPGQREILEKLGIETIQGNLLDHDFLNKLPPLKNVFFLAGMKFGAVDNLPLTWAVNSYLPGMAAEHFRDSRIVVFSTGCVYPLVEVNSGGSVESDPPVAIGEYAQSCLGRERMFEYVSKKYGTPVVLIRLNYSVEMRYGVLVDIGTKVFNKQPVDLKMGYFNVIWQGDMNDFVLRSMEYTDTPARILNITGPEILSVREVALEFGKLFGVNPDFINQEAETALLSNSSEAYRLFGKPKVPAKMVIGWIAEWLKDGKRLLGKPTHFEVRDGKY
ncbi:MAG TPA: epimerase [Bacteroidales bacterium]|nr:epimerase [Bacteroidales bacterium]